MKTLSWIFCGMITATFAYAYYTQKHHTDVEVVTSLASRIEVNPRCRLVGLLISDEQAVLREHWFDTNVLKIYSASYELGVNLGDDNREWYQWSNEGTSVMVKLPRVEILNADGIDASKTIDVYGITTDSSELDGMQREAEHLMRKRAMTDERVLIARRNIENLVRGLFYTLPKDSVSILWR